MASDRIKQGKQKASEVCFRELFDNMTEGFALGEVILDADGRPVDYRILEINEAFLRQSGLPRSIVGQPIAATLKQVEPVWVERYGRVALTGEAIRFTEYNEATQRHYEVYSYCPGPGRFANLFRDITAEKAMQDALTRSEARYRALFESIDDGFCVIEMLFDAKGRPVDYVFIEANPAFEKHTGLHDAIGRRMKDLVPDHDANWFEIYGRVALTGEPVRFVNRADAMGRQYEVRAFRFGAPEERRVAILFEDVTEKKEADHALRESANLLTSILEQLPVAVALIDHDGHNTYANPLFRKYLPEMIPSVDRERGNRWRSVDVDGNPVPPRQWPGARALRGESVLPGMEFSYMDDDGREHWLQVSAIPLLDTDGRIQGANAVMQDITDRKHVEETFRTSEARLRLAQQIGRIGTFEWHVAAGKSIWSPELEALHGLPPGGFGGTFDDWIKRVHPEDVALTEHIYEKALQTGQYVGEWRVIWPDGTAHWLAARGQLFFDAGGQPERMIGVNMDITDRKAAEDALRKGEARFALLSETAGALLVTADPQALMDELCRKVMLHLDCDLFFNFMADESAGRLRLNACAGIPEEEAHKIEWLDYGVAVCGCVARDRQRVIAEDITHTPDIRTELVRSYGVQAYCCHPLMAGERLIGTLSFGATRRTRFSDEDVELMQAVSNQVSVAMERIQREVALKESEERYRSFVQASSQIVWTTNARGEVVLDIPAWQSYTGQGVKEAQGFGWMNVVWPEDRQRVAEAWRKASEARTIYEAEYLLRRHDGVWRNILARGVPVFDPDGSVREYVGACIDITEQKRAEEKLRESEERLNRAQEIAQLGSWELDLVNNVLIWSDQAYRIFGLQPQEFGSTYEAFLEIVHPDDREAVDEAYLSSLREGRDSYEIEHRIVQKSTGEIRHVHEKCTHFRDKKDRIIRSVGMTHDITERKHIEDELKLAATVYQDSSEAMLVSDADNNIIAVNHAFTQITGYTREEAIGKNPSLLKSDRHDSRFYLDMWEQIRTTGRFRGDLWSRRKNGELFAAQITVNTIFGPDGKPHRHVALISDITEKKRSEDIIWSQANFDALTGLPNRHYFRERLEHEIRNARRVNQPMALMFLDLDGFKDINDTLGHDMGDLLLKKAAERLKGCVRDIDTVARLGGDEFTVILSELHDPENADRVARHILKVLSDPIELGDQLAYVSASIGITLYPQDAVEIEGLIKNADQAMYAAKQEGKNQYHYFTRSMQEDAIYRMRLINDLRVALEDNQFEVVYQPIIELATGKIQKAEALIRWHHPARGLINPIEFISAAEDAGMIASFGNWVFHHAARQVISWREHFHPEFQISVNISPMQFRKDGINPSDWLDHLQSLDLPGHGIVIEITEGLLLDATPKVISQLAKLRELGIEVALDDFGTGYSSLSYLQKFDIDYIKIDRAFVRNLAEDSDDLVLCQAIIAMAHKLGLKVIAEGVESGLQHEILANSGCDYAQGYLFSRPVPAYALAELLKAEPFTTQQSLHL